MSAEESTADRNVRPVRGEEGPQSRIDIATSSKERQKLYDKGSGPSSSLRLNLPAIQSPLGDPAKMQGNSTRGPSHRTLADLTDSLKLDIIPARSPPRPLESPFKRPPALLGPFTSGMQSPEVSDLGLIFPPAHTEGCILILHLQK